MELADARFNNGEKKSLYCKLGYCEFQYHFVLSLFMKESNMQKYVVMIKDGGKWEEYARLKDKTLAETVLKLVIKDFPAKIIELK